MDKNIINQILILKKEIYIIQCKNWIKSKGAGTSAIGITLEKLLGKSEDNFVLPDYNNIELKTRNINSKNDLHLFSCAFDNKPLEMQRLLKIGGYPDKKNPNFNVFQVSIDAINKKRIRKYSYRLAVNYKKRCLDLRIFLANTNKVVTVMSWSFFELEKRLRNKLSYLCIIPAKKTIIHNDIYFKYFDPIFYELKDFKSFLSLIDIGIIKVTFKLSYYHSGERYGQFYDKGTSFDIQYQYIEKLFNKIDL